MNEFAALRTRARQRRDKEIAHARDEYQANLAQIAELEQRLLGKADPRLMKLSAAVEHVISRDQPFTANDIMLSLEALDPMGMLLLSSVAFDNESKDEVLGLSDTFGKAPIPVEQICDQQQAI